MTRHPAKLGLIGTWPPRYARHLLQLHCWLALVGGLLVGRQCSADAQNLLTQSNLIGAPQYQQHNNILHFVVPEGAPNNTYLGNIRSSDGQPPYLVLPAPQTPEHERVAALSINLLNGDLTTNSVLDREHREQYHFVAIVKEPFAEIKCTVTVKDINDNAPMFIMPSTNDTNFVIEMPEGQRGIRKVLPLAVDYDTPQFGIKEFRIVSGNTPSGTFQLVEHEAPARSSLQSNLANDDSSPSIVAGDNPQLMQQLAQLATVLIPSQPVMQSSIVSTSNSAGPNSAVNSVTSSAVCSAQSKFLIDLELNQTLDRENQSSYQLVVEAIDGGQPPMLGRLMVTVNVQDVNDNDPVFNRKSYECQFREDTAKGTLLLRVQAHDADIESNGQISYYIKRHSTSSQTVLINSNSSDSMEMSTNRYNNKQRQQQQAAVLPTANNRLMAAQQRQANSETYESTNPATETLSSFKAKSPSYGNAQEQMFEIDPVKGEIYLNGQLDYEVDQMHEITIEARDHGKPSRSAFVTAKVFVIDVNDDPPVVNKLLDDKKQLTQAPSSEASRSELTASRLGGVADLLDSQQNYLQNFNVLNWFAQINSPLLFVIVLIALFAVAFPVCLVKIKSRQPESDYNDTAGLTLTSNNGQTKQSPNHSTSKEHSNGSNDIHHRHHDHQRRANGSFGGLAGHGPNFGSIDGKTRYQYHDTTSNTFYRSRAALLHQTLHHQSSHHLSSVHHGHNKGGTMNSIGTHHSAHPSASPLPATPNTTHSLGLPPNLHDPHHINHGHNSLLPLPPMHSGSSSAQQPQLPPTPCNAPASVFSWPQAPGSTMGCFNGTNGPMHVPSGSAIECAPSSQPLDRWFDLGVSSQLVYAHDWYGSYNWDYLTDWVPEYHTLMPLKPADACSY